MKWGRGAQPAPLKNKMADGMPWRRKPPCKQKDCQLPARPAKL